MGTELTPVQWLADKLKTEYGYDLTVHEHPRKMLEEALELEKKSLHEFGNWFKSDPIYMHHSMHEVVSYYVNTHNPKVRKPNTRIAELDNVYKRMDGSKFVVTERNIEEVNSNIGDFDFVCESAHKDRDYSYTCTFRWCRCHN